MADKVKDPLAELNDCTNFTLEFQQVKGGPLYVDKLSCPYDQVMSFAARVAACKDLKELPHAELHAHLKSGQTAVLFGDINKQAPACSYVVRNKGTSYMTIPGKKEQVLEPKPVTTAVTTTSSSAPLVKDNGLKTVNTRNKYARSMLQ